MNSAEPCLASRPITTLDKPLEIKNAAIPAAVRPTTARFIPDGPGRTGPRNPAVPNSRKPLNDLRSSLSLFSESHLARREADLNLDPLQSNLKFLAGTAHQSQLF